MLDSSLYGSAFLPSGSSPYGFLPFVPRKQQRYRKRKNEATGTKTSKDQKPLRFRSCRRRTISIIQGIPTIVSKTIPGSSPAMKSGCSTRPMMTHSSKMHPIPHKNNERKIYFFRLIRLSIPINLSSIPSCSS